MKKYIRIKNFALTQNSTYFSHILGNKQFELSNHLTSTMRHPNRWCKIFILLVFRILQNLAF